MENHMETGAYVKIYRLIPGLLEVQSTSRGEKEQDHMENHMSYSLNS